MTDSKMAKWISKNWKSIWGHGTYLCAKDGQEAESGFYVVVPLVMIVEELGVSRDYLMYGEDE